jgi:hypothetical protein
MKFDLLPVRCMARNANAMETGVANVEILENSVPLRLAVVFDTAISLLVKIAWRPEQIMKSAQGGLKCGGVKLVTISKDGCRP